MKSNRAVRNATAVAGLAGLSACVSFVGGAGAPGQSSAGGLVATATGEALTAWQLAQRLRDIDVVFFGEKHGDTAVHRTEAALLTAAAVLGRPVILSLEMFERDAQRALDDYLAGEVTEADFLKRARPWPRYAADYRPLVELARTHRWPVVAANVPRPVAAAVAGRAHEALDSVRSLDPSVLARDIQCPDDAYRERFLAYMREHPAGGASAMDTIPAGLAERFYLAQCTKDETMAESIVQALREAPANALLVHVTGSFHSDYRQGTVQRVLLRAPRLRIAVISAIAAGDSAAAGVPRAVDRADYLIFTTPH